MNILRKVQYNLDPSLECCAAQSGLGAPRSSQMVLGSGRWDNHRRLPCQKWENPEVMPERFASHPSFGALRVRKTVGRKATTNRTLLQSVQSRCPKPGSRVPATSVNPQPTKNHHIIHGEANDDAGSAKKNECRHTEPGTFLFSMRVGQMIVTPKRPRVDTPSSESASTSLHRTSARVRSEIKWSFQGCSS